MAKEYDAIVVGSGPGGASAARELVKAGKSVLMIEAGPDSTWAGNSLAALHKADLSNTLPIGHAIMVRGLTVGGSTYLYCGTATRPAAFIKEQTGIDLAPYADEFEEELGIATLPDELVGDAAKRMMDAANSIGIDWKLLPKFIDPEKCKRDCGDCMLGCKTGAKWTSRQFVQQAKEAGMDLMIKTWVDKVIHENGKAVGVKLKGGNEIRADKVVMSAGGLGTPVILKRSGIEEAGQGFFSDPLLFTYGRRKGQEKGSVYDIPMTGGTWQFHEKEGFMMTDLAEPWLMEISSMMLKVPPKLTAIKDTFRLMGIMTKVKDPVSGTISENGKLRKKIEPEVWQRLESGDRNAREILLAAGCDKSSLFTSPVKAAHPGGSAPIGKVVDNNLETQIKGLYVSDASVVPDELGTPVVLLALCIGKYAAQKMLANWN